MYADADSEFKLLAYTNVDCNADADYVYVDFAVVKI